MSSKLKVLQVIPKLGYGGAETGCYDLAHYLHEQNAKSYIVTSGGPLLKYIDKKKVKLIRLPVQSKNPILIFINSIILAIIILVSGINMSIRHIKQSEKNAGGRIPKESQIHISNLALIDPKSSIATKVGFKLVDGKKIRFAKKSGELING